MLASRDNRKKLLSLALSPRFILCSLALANLLAVPQRFSGLCFYNWRDTFYLAVTVLASAIGLSLAKWWSYVGALILSSTIIYDFGNVALKVFGFIATSSAEADGYAEPAVWLNAMRHHPEEIFPVVLAAAIFVCAAVYLRMLSFQPRRVPA